MNPHSAVIFLIIYIVQKEQYKFCLRDNFRVQHGHNLPLLTQLS